MLRRRPAPCSVPGGLCALWERRWGRAGRGRDASHRGGTRPRPRRGHCCCCCCRRAGGACPGSVPAPLVLLSPSTRFWGFLKFILFFFFSPPLYKLGVVPPGMCVFWPQRGQPRRRARSGPFPSHILSSQGGGRGAWVCPVPQPAGAAVPACHPDTQPLIPTVHLACTAEVTSFLFWVCFFSFRFKSHPSNCLQPPCLHVSFKP